MGSGAERQQYEKINTTPLHRQNVMFLEKDVVMVVKVVIPSACPFAASLTCASL